MTRLIRMVPLVAVTLVGFAVAAPTGAMAQESTIPASEAEEFLGEWTLNVDAQGMMLVVNLDITDENGNVAATMIEEMTGTAAAETIARDGEHLVLNYSVNAQGDILPVTVRLTPNDEGLSASFDVAQGMMSGTALATRR